MSCSDRFGNIRSYIKLVHRNRTASREGKGEEGFNGKKTKMSGQQVEGVFIEQSTLSV